MSVRAPIPTALLALVTGAACAWALSACGGDDGAKIPSGDAAAITEALQQARADYAGGDCDAAADAVAEAQRAADGLPRSVDPQLRERIAEGFDALDRELRPDCEAAAATETVPTTTETLPETDTTTTETSTTETQTTPTETQTTPPETTPTTPAETTPTTPQPQPPPSDGTGGISPEGDGQ